MPAASPIYVPPDVIRDVTAFARTLMAAVKARQLYSPDHPNAAAAAGRVQAEMETLTSHRDLQVGVSPDTLLINGEPLPADRRIAEAAALLHDHDILRLRFLSTPTLPQLSDFFELLTFDADTLRRRGGPAE
ncbi:MAG: hypothetical protein NTY02_14215, partial [Acidobacteria bacterium]|nr:hypothetical protein [Acidobacteriota bacterium]